MLSSLRTYEWGLSGHRNTAAIMTGGCPKVCSGRRCCERDRCARMSRQARPQAASAQASLVGWP